MKIIEGATGHANVETTAPGFDSGVEVVDLRTSDSSSLIATGIATPRLRWRLVSERSEVRQIAYEVEVSTDAGFKMDVQSSGFMVSSSPLYRPWPAGSLRSREVRWWRVRVWTTHGYTRWSTPARIEAGLLRSEDWVARPIGASNDSERHESASVTLLRRAFRLDEPIAQARLYVTALGVHQTSINGRAVSEDLLEPGWTAYKRRLLYAAYDVTGFLKPGENVIGAAVGEGWWARDLTRRPFPLTMIYGRRTALLAQLEILFTDGSIHTIATDATWRSGKGALRTASIFNGVEVDLRCEPAGWQQLGFDDSKWGPVVAGDLPTGLEVRSAPAVRVLRSFESVPAPTPWGTLLIDTGQNLTGYLRLRARGEAGATVTVRHAEVLDEEGKLHTAPLNGAKATDRYTLADERCVGLQPNFTYHGFRYAEIIADASVVVDEVTVLVVASDVPATGSFGCSDTRLNKLFENVRWSQQGNFLSLPTDCPQRDERLGWTGDIQVFAPAACVNSDVRAFLASWLIDLAAEQRADGCVSNIVPNLLGGAVWEYGSAGWGDAATLVPWTLYEAYGDEEVLRVQFESMRAWVDWCASRRGTDGTWTGDFQFGDWADPNAPLDKPTTDSDYIASAYLSNSARIVARTAEVLKNECAAGTYSRLSADVAEATWRRWRSHALSTQTGCAIALQFGIAPEEEQLHIAECLALIVERNGAKVGTGFLGTPLVLPALARGGHTQAAYRLLLNTECPGWLYQVLHGATTMWERWDAIKPDGTIHEGKMTGFTENDVIMLSFNHYAFGAVAAWLYRSVAGIAPTASDPGYGTVIFAPLPGGGLTFARASVESPYGLTSIAWNLEDSSLHVDLEIPPGARGWFISPPGRWRTPALENPLSPEPTPETTPRLGHRLTSGRHRIRLQRDA